MSVTQKEAVEKFITLYREIVTLEQNVDQLFNDLVYDKQDNPSGIDKAELKDLKKAAEIHCRDTIGKLEDKINKDKAFIDRFYDLV